MCGIAGFLGPWPVSLAEAMIGAERHRGPDGEGCWSDAAAAAAAADDATGVALGHVRLSIIDLTEAAAQPMISADGRYVIVFNGEIYNYRSLRQDLESAGVGFRTTSDTEVLLELYAREGASAVERLHGIFAFAIWDRQQRRLFLARDPLGVKPLYYAALPQGFLFASELKALTLCRDVPRDIDPVAVADHLGFLWTAGEATMLKSVRKLRPGCTLTVGGGDLQIHRYYRAPLSSNNGSASPSDMLADLIDTVVAEQMVADVEVGALLSGGVDSSAIVASMCRVTDPANITTFCAVVEKSAGGSDNFGDDARFAADVAKDLGVRLIEVPTDADLIDALPGMVWALDEPTADFSALQTQFLARAAREAGIKVLMSGVGGDDLFTGYGRHSAAMAYAALGRVPGLRALAAGAMRCFSPGSIRGRRLRRMGELFAMGENAMLAEAMSFSAVAGTRRRSLLAPGLRDHMPADGIPAAFAESFKATEGLHPVERLLDLELNGFMPDHNLNYTDKMAMQEGVEVRVPLCDPRLVDFAMKLPLADRIDFRTTKKILRDSQRGRVPDAVLTRAKQGFGVPVRGWLAGPARPLMEELTSRDVIEARGLFDAGAVAQLREDFLATRVDAAMTLFPLMAIELWCRALDAAPYAETGAAQ
jgi:asparagine synthase (glutamine-hydrolysing)